MFPLGLISGLTDSNFTVLGSDDTYFSVLKEGDLISLNEEIVEVNEAITDSKITLKTAFTSGNTGDMIYSIEKCPYLRYQIWKIDRYIANYDFNMMGIDTVKGSFDEIKFNTSLSPISQLLALRAKYVSELSQCEADKNGADLFMFRRAETGTF